MKKYLHIIFINILFIILIFLGLNWFVEAKLINSKSKIVANIRERIWNIYTANSTNSEINLNDYEVEPTIVKKIKLSEDNFNRFCYEQRAEYGIDKNYKNNPIIILGCSYAYGQGLNKEQTFPNILSNITKRPIINTAGCGGDIIKSFFNLESYARESQKQRNMINETEYIIYIYMWDHINRYLSLDRNYLYLYYNELFHPEGFEKFAITTPLGKYILSLYRLRKTLHGYPFKDNSSELLKKFIIIINNELHQYAPNAKMIIIIYDEKIPDRHDPQTIKFISDKMNDKIWQELRKQDITVVHTKDITGFYFDKDYKLKEDVSDWHPNEKAWEVFTPEFAQRYIK